MNNKRKLVIYIATSLDGYIATHDEDLSFLDTVAVPGEDYGYAEFIKTVDTVIVGRKTYDWVLRHAPAFSHADKKVFVVTRSKREPQGNVTFFDGDLAQLVNDLKLREGKDIFCDGGSQVIHELLKHQLVDEFYISVVPVILGSGIKLFSDGRPGLSLKLNYAKAFPSGLVQAHYSKK